MFFALIDELRGESEVVRVTGVHGLPMERNQLEYWKLAKGVQAGQVTLQARDIEALAYHLENLFMGRGRRIAGIDQRHTLRFSAGNGEEGIVHASEKCEAFLFEAILVDVRGGLGYQVAMSSAFQADCKIAVEENGEVGLKVIAENPVQGQNRFAA